VIPSISAAPSSTNAKPQLSPLPSTTSHVELSPSKDEKLENDKSHLTNLLINTLNALLPNDSKESDWLIKPEDLEYSKSLGRGAFGKVFNGLHKQTKVDIQVLATPDDKSIEDFKKQFQIMSTVRSPYITQLLGVCLEPKFCAVMEHCSRGSLFHFLKTNDSNIGWEKMLKFATEATMALECLHTWDPPVFHRDIKSMNYLIDRDWHLKMTDFGLARFNTTSSRDSLKKLCGTFTYQAPEMVDQSQPYSAKCDVYSLGIVLWEMIYRVINGQYQIPYGEYPALRMDFDIIFNVAQKNLRPTIPKTCHAELATLVSSCWTKDPSQRPTATEVLKSLNELENDFRRAPAMWNGLIINP